MADVQPSALGLPSADEIVSYGMIGLGLLAAGYGVLNMKSVMGKAAIGGGAAFTAWGLFRLATKGPKEPPPEGEVAAWDLLYEAPNPAALNPPSAFPIVVSPTETLHATRIIFTYGGPAQTLYVCWGLDKGAGDFNNGALLEGGIFASAQISVPDTVAAGDPTKWWQQFDIVIDAALDLAQIGGLKSDAGYDVLNWVSRERSAIEARFATLVDTDAGVFYIPSAQVQAVEALYA